MNAELLENAQQYLYKNLIPLKFTTDVDCFGNETYNKEFVTLGKRFIDRVKRNIG